MTPAEMRERALQRRLVDADKGREAAEAETARLRGELSALRTNFEATRHEVLANPVACAAYEANASRRALPVAPVADLAAIEERVAAVVEMTETRLGQRVGADELGVALRCAADVPALLRLVREGEAREARMRAQMAEARRALEGGTLVVKGMRAVRDALAALTREAPASPEPTPGLLFCGSCMRDLDEAPAANCSRPKRHAERARRGGS